MTEDPLPKQPGEDNSLKRSPYHISQRDSSLEESCHKSIKLEVNMEQNVLYNDSPMLVKTEPSSPILNSASQNPFHNDSTCRENSSGKNGFHLKLEPPDDDASLSSPDLTPDSPLSSSSGSYLPGVPSPISSQVLRDDSEMSAFKTIPIKQEDSQKHLQLIKLTQIRSAFNNTSRSSSDRPKSIGQMFALKKRIKQAQLNGDESLTENAKRIRAVLQDGKVKNVCYD